MKQLITQINQIPENRRDFYIEKIAEFITQISTSHLPYEDNYIEVYMEIQDNIIKELKELKK